MWEERMLDDGSVMSTRSPDPVIPWVVLLGGRGDERAPTPFQVWAGLARPPQFRTFVGSRSVIRHAADRARRLTHADRLVTVIDRRDRAAFEEAAGGGYPGQVLFQPTGRGTAPETLLALSHVLAEDPDAVVLILPANHFVFPEGRFLCLALFALQLASRAADRLVFLGQVPEGPETDYGWIEPGAPTPGWLPGSLGKQPLPVRRLHDRPLAAEAQSLFRRGCLLNTKVLAARGRTLWRLGQRQLPAIHAPFEAIRAAVRRGMPLPQDPDGEDALGDLYRGIVPADLFRDLLAAGGCKSLVLRMSYLQWSDWGRTRRVRQTLNRIGRYPSLTLRAG